MTLLCLGLVPLSFVLALAATRLVLVISRRASLHDSAGVQGQDKAPSRRIPNTGGIGIAIGVVVPVLLGLIGIWLMDAGWLRGVGLGELAEQLPGLRQSAGGAAAFCVGVLVLHLMGLYDDRRPLGPWPKLTLMLGVAAATVIVTDTRLLTLVDGHVGGSWLSVAITCGWFVVVINAMNFIDNMDGLSAGVAAIASAVLLAAAMIGGQWFVGAGLALLLGSALGFLVFNAPPARIFMGDGGSLVLGYGLAFFSARITYIDATPSDAAGGWFAVFMPLVVLAVPLYDFLSVVLVRLSQGRSPLLGDLQHLSHRLVKRGLSRRAAVLVIWGLTLATGLAGVMLAALAPWQAVLVGLQTLLLLGVLAVLEFASSGARDDERPRR